MTGVALIIAFVLAIIVMIVAISKFKVHPFLAIMAVSLILAMLAGIPFVDTVKPDGTKVWNSNSYRSWILRYIQQHRYCYYIRCIDWIGT